MQFTSLYTRTNTVKTPFFIGWLYNLADYFGEYVREGRSLDVRLLAIV
jgi:hypothetical protein